MRGVFFSILIVCLLVSNLWSGEITGKVSAKRLKSPKNILVYIEKVEGKKFSPITPHPTIDQINLTFVPYILPVLAGTTVEFHNSDKARHNIFGIGADKFDLGTYGKGAVKTHTFNKLGAVTLLCNVHHEMEAFVVVLQNPYFALTNEMGEYTIKNVPGGTYKLKTWYKKLKPQTQVVVVEKNTPEVVANFTIK